MAASKTEYVLESLKPGDRVTGLSIGNAQFLPLKTFFQNDSKRFEANSLARTYVMREITAPKILAYITLVCGEIEIENGANLLGGGRYPYKGYPAIKIARLLVDARQRGKDIGRTLIDFALGTTKNFICPAVGCRLVAVDAKAGSVAFYEKCGFTLLDTPANRARPEPLMFIDLLKAVNAN